MSKKKKSAVLIESDSDDSDSGKDLEEVIGCTTPGKVALAQSRQPAGSSNTDHGHARALVVPSCQMEFPEMENFVITAPGVRKLLASLDGSKSTVHDELPARVGLKCDGTLSHPRICKPLYGPSQGDETGD